MAFCLIKHKTQILILLFFLWLPVSCASKPLQHPVPLTVPDHFSSSGEAPLPGQWWTHFDDPALIRLIEQALSNNFSLRSAWDRLAQNEAIAQRERAARFPTLELQGGASRTETHGNTGGTLTTGQQSRSFKRYFLGLTTNYELDLWGRISSIQEAAKLDLKASRETLQAAAMTLSAEVAFTWFELTEQQGQLELLEKQQRTNKQVLELVTFRFRHGQVGATDVLQQRQLLESTQGELATAQSREKVLRHQLAVLLGQPPTLLTLEQHTPMKKIPPLPDTGFPAEIIQNRPDIRSAYYKLLAADQDVATAVSNRFPRISLSAQINTSGESVRDLFDNWLTTLAANLVGPLIDGGNRRAEVSRSEAVVNEQLNNYRQAILEALAEVESALVQEEQQRLFISSLEKQLALSQQVLQQTQNNYRQGAADYLRILDVLLTQQALERALLQARREALSFRVNLYRAIGGGWEMTPPAPIYPPQAEFTSHKMAN